MPNKQTSAIINPVGSMTVLSAEEVKKLHDTSQSGLYQLFRECALAILNCEEVTDNADEIMSAFYDFNIEIIQKHQGVKLQLTNAPTHAFVKNQLILGIRENLFSVLRDILYVHSQPYFNKHKTEQITNLVFCILRNARAFTPKQLPSIVVCWGGHAISKDEYQYTKKVGYQLGLRKMDICTGCGPGAMKGPMKGAYIGHAKQRINEGRFIGLTEPSIIAAESPNPIVNELIIMPDIEKRLEAFVRLGHGIIVFPGGAGTAEEILYLLGILLHPDNEKIPFPLIFTGPACSQSYFTQIDNFIRQTLGMKAQNLYQIIIDNPQLVAEEMKKGIQEVTRFRRETSDAYYFNWQLKIDSIFQQPFAATHNDMAQLKLDLSLPKHQLASQLRQAMSGIVTGNVKQKGITDIREKGPFQLKGDPELMKKLDKLLNSFVKQKRMKLPGSVYKPCYEIHYEKPS